MRPFTLALRALSRQAGLSLMIVLTLALLGWQRHVIGRTGSLAIATDHVHYKSNLFLNLTVIAALGFDQYAGPMRCSASPSCCGWGGVRGALRATRLNN